MLVGALDVFPWTLRNDPGRAMLAPSTRHALRTQLALRGVGAAPISIANDGRSSVTNYAPR